MVWSLVKPWLPKSKVFNVMEGMSIGKTSYNFETAARCTQPDTPLKCLRRSCGILIAKSNSVKLQIIVGPLMPWYAMRPRPSRSKFVMQQIIERMWIPMRPLPLSPRQLSFVQSVACFPLYP